MDITKVLDEYFPRTHGTYGVAQEAYDSASRSIIAKSIGSEVVDREHGVQQIVRPLFNKPGICMNVIGGHPDYQYLADEGGFRYGSICTLFIDIVKSSRLNVLYSLEEACSIKNRILQIAIEIVRAFDGYPHRMMGDAVMAFFGDREKSDEQASIDIINCAVVLRFFVVNYIVPRLEEITGIDESKLGIRIGVDYGDEDSVIWGAFGYSSAFEVTAHGVSVDLCSKLQGMAGKNNVMMGQGVMDFIDYPESFSYVKQDSKGPVPHVKPNLTDADRQPINYRCRIINNEQYFSLLPLPEEVKQESCDYVSDFDGVIFYCEYSDGQGGWHEYPSVSKPLGKEVDLKFKVLVRCDLLDSDIRHFKFKFTKVNHGEEARLDKQEGKSDKGEIKLNNKSERVFYSGGYYYQYEFPEATRYRGIHEMRVKGEFNGSRYEGEYKNTIGVFIV